jgi:hypothetical protein
MMASLKSSSNVLACPVILGASSSGLRRKTPVFRRRFLETEE